jgi:hypothetical protein
MRRVGRRCDGDHGARFFDAMGGREHSGAAQAVAYQQRRRAPCLAQVTLSPVKSKRSAAMPWTESCSAIDLAARMSLPQVKQCANSAIPVGSPSGKSSTPANFSPFAVGKFEPLAAHD